MRTRAKFARRVIPEGLPFELDPTRPDQAGWGIIVPNSEAEQTIDALKTLLEHRKGFVPGDRVKLLSYNPGETPMSWLRRHGAYPGTISPIRVPYFLMIAAGPAAIPWRFQTSMSLEYAVGRAGFENADEMRAYATGVVDYETGLAPLRAREIAFWATRHPADTATRMSADDLVGRLWQGCPPDESPIGDSMGFRPRGFLGDSATRSNLSRLINGPELPSVVVTASHGLEPDPHERAVAEGLVAQDWDGFGPILREHAFTSEEIADDARLAGLIALIFACYGAGSEGLDVEARETLIHIPSPKPSVSALARRLMGHPGGGAMAILGHVGRAWGHSIRPAGLSPQIGPLRNFLGRVLRGEPVGHAMKAFAERHALIASAIVDHSDTVAASDRSRIELADARDFVLLGDPATRLKIRPWTP